MHVSKMYTCNFIHVVKLLRCKSKNVVDDNPVTALIFVPLLYVIVK